MDVWQAASYFGWFDKFAQVSRAKNMFLLADRQVAWNCQRFIDVGIPLRWSLWSFHSVLECFLQHASYRFYRDHLTCIGPELVTNNFYTVVMLVLSRTCSLKISKWLSYCHTSPPLELHFLEFLSHRSPFEKQTDVWDSFNHLSMKNVMPQEIKKCFFWIAFPILDNCSMGDGDRRLWQCYFSLVIRIH